MPKHCPECGYDLRGIDGTRCPECGHVERRTGRWEPDRVTVWFAGVLCAAPFIVIGTRCITRQSATMPGYRTSVRLTGPDAIAFGCAIFAIGLFLHVRFFWGNSKQLARWSDAAQLIPPVIFIVSIAYLAVRMVVFG